MFEFDPTTDRFMGPAQHERMLAVAAAELKLKEEEKASKAIVPLIYGCCDPPSFRRGLTELN